MGVASARDVLQPAGSALRPLDSIADGVDERMFDECEVCCAPSEKDEKVKIDDVIQFRRTGSVPHPSVNTSTDD
jgi:hypothetical protein